MKTKSHHYDVVVTGAGILGSAVAAAVARRNMSVCLLDAGAMGQCASANSFCWINATSKISDAAYFDLNVNGLQRYHEQAAEYGADNIGLHQCGMLEWADHTDPDRLSELASRFNILKDRGYIAAQADYTQLADLEPDIVFEAGSQGLVASSDCWLDVEVYLGHLRQRLTQQGAHIMEYCRALQIDANDQGKITGVVTTQGRIECENLVLATGPESPEVLDQLTGHHGFAARFPVHRTPGLLVTTPPGLRVSVRHVVYTPDPSGFHIRPAACGGLVMGADDTDGMLLQDKSHTGVVRAASVLLRRVQRYLTNFPEIAVENCTLSVGTRVEPIDGRAILGPALDAEGLYLVVSHSGITLAPELGEMIAGAIEHGSGFEPIQPYSLDRFT